MSIYLQYRLESEGITCLNKVYIEPPDEPWIFDQIVAEISNIFPDAIVQELPEQPDVVGCGLLVFPDQHKLGPREVLARIRTARDYRPDFLMFYGVTHRSVDVVPWASIWAFWLSRSVERLVRSSLHPRQTAARVARGLTRRGRLGLWRRRATEATMQ